jgi:hypothetical protein
VARDDRGEVNVGIRHPARDGHLLQVAAHGGQRPAELPPDGGCLPGIPDAQAEHEPAGIRLRQQGGATLQGLRRPGPYVGDARSEHHPPGGRQQHGELHESVLAARLVGPRGAVAAPFQAADRLALLVG